MGQTSNQTNVITMGPSSFVGSSSPGHHPITSSSKCDCANPSKGFSGCASLCGSPFQPVDPMCKLKEIPFVGSSVIATLAAGIIVAIAFSVCIFCACILGCGYWVSLQHRKQAALQELQRQGATSVSNPVASTRTDAIPKAGLPEENAEKGFGAI